MAQIEDVYNTYFQKSKLFLYPALNIKKGQSISLIQTYIGLQNKINITDYKLIALYYYRDDLEFKHFESKYLCGNPLYSAFYLIDADKIAYVFDFNTEELKHNFECFIKGNYSNMSTIYKKIVMEHYKDNSFHQAYMDSFLNPDPYYNLYGKVLSSHDKEIEYITKLLEKVGELCSIPDIQKEVLITSPNEVKSTKSLLPLAGNQQ